MSSAEYRLLGADGAQLEAGSGDVTVAGGVLELQPAGGTALRVPSGRIASVAEPEPFVVRVTLADGTALELSRLGRMRTQLLEELRDARAGVAAARLEDGAVGADEPVLGGAHVSRPGYRTRRRTSRQSTRIHNSRKTSSRSARRPGYDRMPGRIYRRRSLARRTGTGRSPGRGS